MYKILLVEDDETQRRMIQSLLESPVYEITTANDGRAAIHELAIGSFDVILLDLHTPLVRGELVIQWVLKNRRESISHILVITGLISQGLQAMLQSLDIRLLSKPFLKQDLIGEIERITGGASERLATV